jgi:hypothetical protein
MAERRSPYEASITGDAQSADPISPISYVSEHLGWTFRILLIDGHRVFQGLFSALDHTGMLAFRNAIELTEDHEHQVGVCVISLNNIQSMEVLD